jgi:hypothetical protein
MNHFLDETVLGTGSLKQEFDQTSGRYHDSHEIETKALICGNGLAEFRKLLDRFASQRLIFGKVWSKFLVSAYYDTPDMKLFNAGKGLRLRFQVDDKINPLPYAFDISSKSRGEAFGANGVRRIEPEAVIDDLALNLPALFQACNHCPDTIKYLTELVGMFDNDPGRLREALFVDCERTNFNVCVYIVNYKGQQYAKFGSELNGDVNNARPVFFEFSLDHPEYRVPGIAQPVGEDYEIEFEFKEKTDYYAPEGENYQSAADLNLSEIICAQEYLVNHINNTLEGVKLAWKAPSKMRRGFMAREKYAKNNALPEPEELTVAGKPIAGEMIVPAPANYFLINKSADLSNGPC